MWVKRLLLGISLLGLIAGVKSQLTVFPSGNEEIDNSVPSKDGNITYIMSFSTVLQSGKTGHVCIFTDCEESVQVVVTMEYQITRTSIFNDQISAGKFFECRDFSVPTVNTTQLAYVTFSAIGETVDKRERKNVAIDNMPESCFVQMEKKLYKPGDTVRCRLFCLDSELKPTKQNFTRVFLMDPKGARVAQIVEPLSDHDVVSVEFTLTEDAPGDYWTIEFRREPGNPVTKYFQVEKYELPRFDSTVTCPNTISVLEDLAEIEISAQYVYGKPLPGTVIAKCCRRVGYSYGRAKNCVRGLEDICVDFTAELDSGAYTEFMSLDTFKLQFSEYDSSIQCEVTVKEAGTGVLDTKSCYMFITDRPANLQLDYSYYNQYYRHGLDYPFAATLTDEKGQPMPNEIIVIEVDGQQVKTLTTDAQGRVECGIDTTPYYKPNITIRASYPNEDQCYSTSQQSPWYPRPYNGFYPSYNDYPYPYTETIVYRVYSESDSFLQINKKQGELTCYETHRIEVEYKVTEAGVGKGVTSTTFYYMVLAKQQIVLNGQQNVDLTDSWKGSFIIDLTITPKYATNAQVLVFGAMQTEIISVTMELTIESCFNNRVSLTFTESVVAPGSEVQQELTAAPGSVCGLRASDASLNLLRSYDSFSPQNILNSLLYSQYGFQVQNFNLEDPEPPCEDPNEEVFCNGRYYRPVSSWADGDTYSDLQAISLIVTSNLRVRKPQVCGMEKVDTPRLYKSLAGDSLVGFSASPGAGASGSIETLRSNFDHAFGWQMAIIGSDGKGIATSTIPDTITEWNSEMFCISEAEGVGLTNQTAKVTTFLPFFVEMTAPQYCTRGDNIIVAVSAANYLEDKCMKVEITIEDSDSFELEPLSDMGQTCICNGERASKQWSLNFISIGDVSITVSASTAYISNSCTGTNDESQPSRKDTVIETLKVEAEGIKREVTFSHLNSVNGSTTENEVTVESPDNLVEGSDEFYLTVVGDTVGLMAENLDNLLNLPDGCCEQSLARLPPVVYMVKYLNETGSLSAELYEKAKSQLSVGYGRQLACRQWDGQYSVFRNSYLKNSWLDVNTFYTLELMKEFVYVDDSVQQQSLSLLGNLQDLNTGCFRPTGSLFTIQDDKEHDLLYTAYVVIRLKKTDLYGIGDSLLQGGLRCLQEADLGSLDTYTLAYVFHAAAVAELDIWENLAADVKERAITEGGKLHWEREDIPLGKSYYFLPRVWSSAEVDITANMMLGFLRRSELTKDDIDYLGQIAVWLSSCQNSRGGFSSSQDTIVATEAMTEYGRRIYVSETNVEVVVSQGDNEVARISVNGENKMLVQKQPILFVSGTLKISTSGTGNPLVQLTAKFNTKVANEGSSFSLTVTTQTETCAQGVAPVINTTVCASYKGSQNQSNMVLIDIKEITGYPTDRTSANQMVTSGTVSEVRYKDNHVHIYLKSMKANDEICFTTISYLGPRVLHYQNSNVILRDYYNADDSAYAAYSHPCSSSPEE